MHPNHSLQSYSAALLRNPVLLPDATDSHGTECRAPVLPIFLRNPIQLVGSSFPTQELCTPAGHSKLTIACIWNLNRHDANAETKAICQTRQMFNILGFYCSINTIFLQSVILYLCKITAVTVTSWAFLKLRHQNQFVPIYTLKMRLAFPISSKISYLTMWWKNTIRKNDLPQSKNSSIFSITGNRIQKMWSFHFPARRTSKRYLTVIS